MVINFSVFVEDHEKRPLALFLTDATRCITADGTLSVGDRLLSVGEHDLTHLDCAAAREVFKKLPVGRVMLKIQRACHPSYWSDDSQSLLVQGLHNVITVVNVGFFYLVYLIWINHGRRRQHEIC